MKHLFFCILAFLISIQSLFSQAPESVNYQAVLRDSNGDIITSQSVSIQFTLRSGSATGAFVYVEEHSIQTNAFGLVNLQIGTGVDSFGTFANIDWGANEYWLQIELDENGGSNYALLGSTKLISVPYALHAKTAESVSNADDADADPQNELQTLDLRSDTLEISNGNYVILNSVVNTDDQILTLQNDTLSIEDGNSVNLSTYLDNTDAQILSISNDTVYLSNGGFVKLPSGVIDTDDQTLSLSNDTLFLQDGGYVILPENFSGDYNDLANTPSNLSDFSNDLGFVTTSNDLDSDTTNELQLLSLSGDTIFLSDGGSVILPSGTIDTDDQTLSISNDSLIIQDGNKVDLSDYLDNTDAQVLSINDDTVFLSNGGYVILPENFSGDYNDLANTPSNLSDFSNDLGFVTTSNDLDSDTTNELQLLSLSGDTIFLSDGGSVILPSGTIDTDDQVLSLSDDTLFLQDGGYVILPENFSGDYNDLTNTPSNLSDFSNDLGFVTTSNDADADSTNELQLLSLSGDTVFLTDGGFIVLPSGTIDTDDQTLSLNGDTLSIADGNSIVLATFNVGEGLLANDSCFSVVMLDAQNTDAQANIGFVDGAWQEFIPQETGELTQLSFAQTTANFSGGTLNIYSGSGTGGALLHTQALAGGSIGWLDYSLTNTVALAQGSSYTFEIVPSITGGLFVELNSAGYPGASSYPGEDLRFRTYVNSCQPQYVISPTSGTGFVNLNRIDTIFFADGSIQTTSSADLDIDSTNELQLLSLSGDTIFLSDGGSVILPSGTIDTDDQTLSLNGDTLSIVDGNSIVLPTGNIWGIDTSGNGIISLMHNGMPSTSTGLGALALGSRNIVSGDFSMAIGDSSFASGDYSLSLGKGASASGSGALSVGYETQARHAGSIASGYRTRARGIFSVATGEYTEAYGYASNSFGFHTSARSMAETTIGMYSVIDTSGMWNGWVATDRLFSIGNGRDANSRSNAMTILKGGNVGLGTIAPDTTFHLVGKMKYQDGTQADGLVLTSDADGNATWQQPLTSANDSIWALDANGTGIYSLRDNGTANIASGGSSFAVGNGNIASNFYAIAIGNGNEATGAASVAGGVGNRATKTGSTAFGNSNIVSGSNAFAVGSENTASMNSSIALGERNIASGPFSLAGGLFNTSSGAQSISLGGGNTAIGANSVALGFTVRTQGNGAVGIGSNLHSRSAFEIAVGSENTNYTPIDQFDWNVNDRLFGIGNGTGGVRSDAMVVLKSGNIGFGTSVPDTTFHLVGKMKYQDGTQTNGYVLTSDADGNASWQASSSSPSSTSVFDTLNGIVFPGSLVDESSDDFVFGSTQLDDDGNVSHDSRFFFDKSKAAFRVGRVTNTNWDTDSLGVNSFASGYNSKATTYSTAMGFETEAAGHASTAIGSGAIASGDNSTAFGTLTTANGLGSTAMGFETTASGEYSSAIGYQATASGSSSVALGAYNIASGEMSLAAGDNTRAIGSGSASFGIVTRAKGNYSIAAGAHSTAESYAQTTVGVWNTPQAALSATSYNAQDRLFVVGNGYNYINKSDAMVILKNGNTGFGISTPDTTFHLVGKMKYQDGTQVDGYILTSDADGNASWQAASSSGMGTLVDADNDTKIQVEESADDDIIRFDMAGTEYFRMDSGRLEAVNTGFSVLIGEGAGAGDDFSDNRNVAVGGLAMSTGATGRWNNAIGYKALEKVTTGQGNTANGFAAMPWVTTGSYNTAIGRLAMPNFSGGSYNTAIGNQATVANGSNYATAVGASAFADCDNCVVLGGLEHKIGIGVNAPDTTLHVVGKMKYQDGTQGDGFVLTSDADGYATWQGLTSLADGDNDTKIQVEEGADDDVIRFDIAGNEELTLDVNPAGIAVLQPTSLNGTFYGFRAGISTTASGVHNASFGGNAGWKNTSGMWNTNIGTVAGRDNETGHSNTNLGFEAGMENTTGSSNVFIGRSAGRDNLGSGNVFIGHRSGETQNVSNQLFIDNSNTALPLVYGEFDNDLMRVNGILQVKGTGSTYLRVIKDDNTTPAVVEFQGSGTTYNIGTPTADRFRLWNDNSGEVFTITPSGNIGLSDTSPDAKLDVNGDAFIEDKLTVTNLTATDSLKVGSAGSTITGIIKYTENRNVTSIGPENSQNEFFTVAGAQVGGVVYISPADALPGNLGISFCRVSAANTVEVRFRNYSQNANVNMAAMDFHIVVIN